MVSVAKHSPWGYSTKMIKDEKNRKYSRLTVVEFSHGKDGAYWLCKCDCGHLKIVKGSSLRSGVIKSCGCLWAEQKYKNFDSGRAKKSHGFPHGRKLKDLYKNMKNRCYDKKNKRYKNYGGRGIVVCDEWLNDRRGFYAWAINNGYDPKLQINRIDNDGNYCPENCNFITQKENVNNTSWNHAVTWLGKTQSISMWAAEMGVRSQALQHRFTRGWDLERAMSQPFRKAK